jgi:hypothetical protein
MKTSKTLLAAAAFAFAAAAPGFAQAAGALLLSEKFNNINSLSDWAQVNNSQLPGQAWFQGNPGVFSSQAGPASAYIAANYLSASNGNGTVDNWLITPELTLSGPTQLSFFTRTQAIPGLNDMLEVRFSPGSGTATSGFTTLLTTIGGASAYPDSWQQFTANLALTGSGRFAFRYLGDAAASNYIGIDTVSITAVPEPSAYLMFWIGAALLSLLRRKQPNGRPLSGE